MSGPAISPGGSVIQATRPEISLHQTVAVGAASAEITNNLRTWNQKPSSSGVIRIVSDTDCHVHIANDPTDAGLTAVATDPLLPAGVVEYWKFKDNDSIAVIQDTAGGTLHVSIVR